MIELTETNRQKIALVITLLNEAEGLQPLLDSIEAQSLEPDEIVICDGGSTDGTLEILKSWRQRRPKYQVTIVKRPGSNIAAGRNTAIRQCQSQIICVTDGSCVLDRKWLEIISRPLIAGDETLGVVYGRTVAIGRSTTGRQFSAFYEAKTRLHRNENELSSRSVAFRRSLWESTGGYPEWLTLAGEDTFFFRQLSKQAGSVFLDEAIVYWHHGAESLRKIFRQQARNSTASGELNLWLPWRYQVLFGIYASVAAGLMASVWKRQVAVPAAILLLAATMRQAPSLFRVKNKPAFVFIWLPPIALVRDLGMIKGYLTGQKIRMMGRKTDSRRRGEMRESDS